MSFVSDDIEIIRSRDRDTHTPSNKNDIDKACNRWNVSNIAKYFSVDDCVTEIKMLTIFSPYLDNIYERVQKDICLRLICFCRLPIVNQGQNTGESEEHLTQVYFRFLCLLMMSIALIM
jgi:hypothetical protein